MISTKISQNSFSKAEQRHDFKDDKLNYAPAAPETTNKGSDSSEGIGDKLNALTRPGEKNPNKATRKVGKNELGKDDFLKLMLTQMKNQDPLNPMQSHEMAAQLAQFTSLEQLVNINKGLDGLNKAQDPMQKYEVLNFLGKTIKADSRQIFHTGPDSPNELRFNTMSETIKGKVTISDEAGKTVKSFEFGGLKPGPNKLVWNGTDQEEREVKPGRYYFNVEAEGKGGKKVGVQTETAGVITGVNYSPEGPLLMVGDQKVRLQDVQKIEDDQLKENQNQRELQGAKEVAKEPARESTQMQRGQQAYRKPVLKPESKDAPKNSQAALPLEVASANATHADSNGGSAINTGGRFGR